LLSNLNNNVSATLKIYVYGQQKMTPAIRPSVFKAHFASDKLHNQRINKLMRPSYL